MSRAAHRRERERPSRLHLPGLVPVDGPIAPRVRLVLRAARPLELLQPQSRRRPVALPVVRARVEQRADAALEQARDVELGWHRILVQTCVKPATNIRVAGAKVGWGSDTEQLAGTGVIKVALDCTDLEIAQVTEAILRSSKC